MHRRLAYLCFVQNPICYVLLYSTLGLSANFRWRTEAILGHASHRMDMPPSYHTPIGRRRPGFSSALVQ